VKETFNWRSRKKTGGKRFSWGKAKTVALSAERSAVKGGSKVDRGRKKGDHRPLQDFGHVPREGGEKSLAGKRETAIVGRHRGSAN